MRKFRILALMLVLIMVLAGCGTGNSTPAAKDIVILYTNDAHCGIEDGMGYQGLSAAKRALLAAGNKVLLVDNGDAVQGDTIGTLSKGEYIIDIMNKLGYDVATPGNHEFDYGMDQFNKLVEKADFDYISCNFVDKDGNPVLKPYVIKEADGVKIAFVGISTPRPSPPPPPPTSRMGMATISMALCRMIPARSCIPPYKALWTPPARKVPSMSSPWRTWASRPTASPGPPRMSL